MGGRNSEETSAPINLIVEKGILLFSVEQIRVFVSLKLGRNDGRERIGGEVYRI